jgi:hypothetical protein
MAMNTANMSLLTRTDLWSAELKEILRDEMQAQKYVRMLDGFGDGNTLHIPSIGQAQVDNYSEDQAVVYRPMDTGEFTFTIDKYLVSATYMTKKAEQDAFYANEMMSRFVPEQERSIMEHFELTTFAAPESGVSANSNESIDGVEHRWAGVSGTIAVNDFARALHALKKANVPQRNLVAVVDPSVEYDINSISNITNVSNNPQWEGIVSSGIASGMKFVRNIFGFDVYTSNFLATVTDSALPDRDNSKR